MTPVTSAPTPGPPDRALPQSPDPGSSLYRRGKEPFQPLAALLALAFPGAGHLYLGYPRRALAIAAGVLGLFAGGVFIGGIDCVDRKEDPIWFAGQALVGPLALGVDALHQSAFKAYDPGVELARTVGDVLYRQTRRSPKPDEIRVHKTLTLKDESGQTVQMTVPVFQLGASASARTKGGADKPSLPPLTKSLGRMNELGTLFGTVAGMMNLICVIDAAWMHRRRSRLLPFPPNHTPSPTHTGVHAIGPA